ncbi:hypothetical protein V6N13_060265 [Hibiscus sabdariffa]
MGEKWVEVIDELRSKFSGPELMLLDLDDGGTFLELDRAANLFVKLSFGFVDRTDNLKAVRCIIEGAHHVVVFLAWLFSVLI